MSCYTFSEFKRLTNPFHKAAASCRGRERNRLSNRTMGMSENALLYLWSVNSLLGWGIS